MFSRGVVSRHSARWVLRWLPNFKWLTRPSPRVKVCTHHHIITSHLPYFFRTRGAHDVPSPPMINPSPTLQIACMETAASTPLIRCPARLRSRCSRIDRALQRQCIRVIPLLHGATSMWVGLAAKVCTCHAPFPLSLTSSSASARRGFDNHGGWLLTSTQGQFTSPATAQGWTTSRQA